MPQYNNNVIFDAEGRQVGSEDARPDGIFRNLNVNGQVFGDFSALAINKLTHNIVAYSATPTFDCAGGTGFEITLNGDVTASAMASLLPGLLVAFIIKQDAAGGHAFAWPANVFGGADIGIEPFEVTTQMFYCDGISLYALTPGVIV